MKVKPFETPIAFAGTCSLLIFLILVLVSYSYTSKFKLFIHRSKKFILPSIIAGIVVFALTTYRDMQLKEGSINIFTERDFETHAKKAGSCFVKQEEYEKLERSASFGGSHKSRPITGEELIQAFSKIRKIAIDPHKLVIRSDNVNMYSKGQGRGQTDPGYPRDQQQQQQQQQPPQHLPSHQDRMVPTLNPQDNLSADSTFS
jgi:hypothetical protein